MQSIMVSGNSANRIDLVFFSDGYTEDERSKFFEDAQRLTAEIAINQTFYPVQPLLNFWAAFTPSAESGVGVLGVPKNTTFGLYRPGTELRGLYYSKPKVADAACRSLGEQCDYPILMGNDPLYGGLGGRFTTITPSHANGALILRHELGHSIIPVGEEYDGGYAYFGVNTANSSRHVGWKHWLTDLVDEPRVERSVMPLQDYTWTILNTSVPWSTKFSSAGTYARHLVRISISGVPAQADLRVELDGVSLGWRPRPEIGIDRSFYDFYREEPLSAGHHQIAFTLLNEALEGVAQLCSVEVLEFGTDDEFSEKNETTYRPTNEDCLMRQVTERDFCKVCLEGLWTTLLSRIDLIDDMSTKCVSNNEQGTLEQVLTLRTLALGQFRARSMLDIVPSGHAHASHHEALRDYANDVNESVVIRWFKDGQELERFANHSFIPVSAGIYRADVSLVTSDVRLDKDGVLMSSRNFIVDGGECRTMDV
ncbi:hypothetical protein FISHEDRAFT_63788 [Fistulina hepatica ATCC 64428]|uniref:IgA peptidase M64 n=1 Tax=Fistulina hepatica ATCC 64428 TaxID=1128425 RepID=A0A0D7AKX1_9AGAR|nr:hypothetical protein FISHEDRAFT_63788 [Fistulina hepatica ATCC 64428]